MTGGYLRGRRARPGFGLLSLHADGKLTEEEREGGGPVAGMIPFTDNYQDHSTRNGWQFEFFCERCGNGYSSSFKKSVAGFGGRLARIGGSLLGGGVGNKMEQVGYQAEWL